jgi:outer membrane protein assembly factor BamB
MVSRRCDSTTVWPADSPTLRLSTGRPSTLAALGLVVGLTLCNAASLATADDWLFARGDVSSSGVAKSTLPDELELRWKYTIEGSGFEATAIVSDGIVYVGDNGSAFHAIKLADGSPVWKKEFESTGFLAGAAFHEGRIYAGDYNGMVWCLAAESGEVVWSVDLEAEFFAAPLISGGQLLTANEGGAFVSLALADGSQNWKYEIEAPLRCTPTVVAGRAVLAGCDGKLHVVDAATGELRTTLPIDGPTGSTPAALGSRVFFGTEQGTFYAIDVQEDADQPPVEAWTYFDPRRRQSIRAAAAVTDDLVVFGSQGKTVYALDPAKGVDPTTNKPKWTFAVRSRVESSPVIAGNRVVFATTRGRLYVVDAASGKAVWEYNAGGSQLIIGNNDGTLYCFSAPTESQPE